MRFSADLDRTPCCRGTTSTIASFCKDVFPTFYRCNTKRSVTRMMNKVGFDVTVVRHEAEPAYMHFSNIAYRMGAIAHRLMPPFLASTLLIYARKR